MSMVVGLLTALALVALSPPRGNAAELRDKDDPIYQLTLGQGYCVSNLAVSGFL